MKIKRSYKDREGNSLEMKKRTIRLTNEENEMLDEILDITKLSLRDLISEMIEERYVEETNKLKTTYKQEM
ncbi:hypothetical protein [Clostridium perfringens]|uniref:hypothetical protein n=1 Tax=Clostridium perfringens TaxID=1502 RepID=UPI001A1DEA30|nr:hypothetical protein [Clostridium perfringens]HAT4254703.1 hypothetical protein [Clostridium perfringens]